MQHRRALVALSISASFLAACSVGTSPGDTVAEPRLSVEQSKLDDALLCTDFTHPDQPPVLLIHGTFTAGYEQYDWTYIPLLSARGFDVCTVTYPDRGFGDQQVSAEYVVNAIRRMHERSGRKIAMIGHSQGASMPRWALKWWPSTRAMVEDFVLQAGPNHGTQQSPSQLAALGQLTGLPIGQMPEAFFQFAPDSQFVAAVNRGDETPGDISYTNLYTQFDELVQPVTPVPTAALDWGQDNPQVANLLLQDVCAGRFVDHVTIGLTDRLAFELTIDAITHPGPANVERAGGAALCGLAAIVPDQIVAPEAVQGMLGAMQQSAQSGGMPDLHLASGEPPLRDYAQ